MGYGAQWVSGMGGRGGQEWGSGRVGEAQCGSAAVAAQWRHSGGAVVSDFVRQHSVQRISVSPHLSHWLERV
jgi:hypothetical protein